MSQFLGNMYTQVTVSGLTAPVTARYEQTDPAVAQQYVTDILPLVTYYQASQSTAQAWTQADALNAQQALTNLLSLAQNGLNGSYLTTTMAQNLDYLVRTFESVGVTVTNGTVAFPSDGLGALQQWKDSTVLAPLIGQLFGGIINAQAQYGSAITTAAGANSATLNQSLQAQIEVGYVQEANTILNTQLTGLQNTLTYLNSVNADLANLQNAHNDMTVNNKTGLPINYSQLWNSAAIGSYNKLASAYFGAPIVPTMANNLYNLTFGTPHSNPANFTLLHPNPDPSLKYWANHTIVITDVVDNFGNGQLITYYAVPLTKINALNSTGIQAFTQLLQTRQDLLAQISNLAGSLSASQLADPNGLYAQLKTVVSDMNTNIYYTVGAGIHVTITLSNYQNVSTTTLFSAFRKWLVDGYDAQGAGTSNQGKIQQDLGTAITAGQNLNSTQTENVRNFMFLFQEFYQSASSVLQSISQIIQKMAQGIKG